MVRSTMLTLAVAALLAVVASAQPGVVLFAEGEHQGALLHTPSPGSQACAEDAHADCAPLEPSAAAAAVAALLRVSPVESVDAHASSQVASLLDRDPSRRPGTVLVARVASATAASALKDFLAGAGAASADEPGASARRVADLGEVSASLDALACAPGVARVRVGDADIGDPAAFGDAVARAVAASHDSSADAGSESTFRATLVRADEKKSAATATVFSGDVFAFARDALDRARAALGVEAVLVVLVADGEGTTDGEGTGETKASRRRLAQDAEGDETSTETFSSSNGNETAVAEKTRRFRDATAMFGVFFLLLVIALCGIMAMTSMAFPSDSLLYPREKNE